VVPEPTRLFEAPLPVDIGPLPSGLANLSAQGCNACHFDAHDGWSESAHARGHAAARFIDALREIDTPACSVCHLPLTAQQPHLVEFDAEDVNRPLREVNPSYSATLHTEGVTCAACHVRDGIVIGASPPSGEAPHPIGWSPELREASFCGTCHQLTWPGANQPLYDTFGEWERSPQGAAGITCQDCHMGPGASAAQRGTNHAFDTATGRAISILVDLPATTLVRGGSPLIGQIVLQNTGAGHAWPTGSPFRGMRIEIFLETSDGEKRTRASAQTIDLARTLEDAPPFQSISDTRLAAGEERKIDWEGTLTHDAPTGPWFLVVRATPTLRGEALSKEVLERRLPVSVE